MDSSIGPFHAGVILRQRSPSFKSERDGLARLRRDECVWAGLYSSDVTTKSKSPLLGLLTSQFLGAFNDNAWKYVILTLAVRPYPKGSPELITESQAQATLVLLTITLPMMVFSLPGGMLADRLSKRSIIRAESSCQNRRFDMRE